jgi:hypothetical protein
MWTGMAEYRESLSLTEEEGRTMTTIKATVRDGRLELDQPIDLPNGTELLIPVPDMATDEGPMSAEEIAQVLAAMDQMIPFDRSPEEEVRLEADRQARKAWELTHADERTEKLRRMWE